MAGWMTSLTASATAVRPRTASPSLPARFQVLYRTILTVLILVRLCGANKALPEESVVLFTVLADR